MKAIRWLFLGIVLTGCTTGVFGFSQDLVWMAPTNGGPVAGYNVEQSTNNGTSFYQIGGTTGATSTNYTVLNCATNMNYCYRVNAYNPAGVSPYSNVACAPTPWPPSITMQPTNLVAWVGGSASFTVVVAGKPPFVYQWQKDGSPIPNATNATYAITTVRAVDAGGYAAVVANVDGAVTSVTATLTVNGAPGAPITIRIINRQ
jgi:hypothetical protein